jgi:hypothetical protein
MDELLSLSLIFANELLLVKVVSFVLVSWDHKMNTFYNILVHHSFKNELCINPYTPISELLPDASLL